MPGTSRPVPEPGMWDRNDTLDARMTSSVVIEVHQIRERSKYYTISVVDKTQQQWGDTTFRHLLQQQRHTRPLRSLSSRGGKLAFRFVSLYIVIVNNCPHTDTNERFLIGQLLNKHRKKLGEIIRYRQGKGYFSVINTSRMT